MPSPPRLLSSRDQLHSQILCLLPLRGTGEQRMGIVVNSLDAVSAAPSSSLPSPAPAWGPTHGRQFSTNFSNVSLSHRLQFMNCPSVGPSHVMQSFRNRLLQREFPTGSQTLPANLLWRRLHSPHVCRSWQKPAPVWTPHGVTAFFRYPPALVWGPFHGPQVEICSAVDIHGLQGDSLPHHGLQHELQG